MVRGELYRRMPGGILTYGYYGEVNLYCRLQRAGFYWPSMGKDADQVQTQCETYQLAADREESYAMFASEDWRSLFMQYLTENILPQKHSERYKLRRLVTRYVLHNIVLFKLLVSKLNPDLGMKPIT